MRLSRRSILTGLGAVVASSVAACRSGEVVAAEEDGAAVQISATPITSFVRRRPDQVAFGELTFRGGLSLRAGHRRFGGFSGLAREDRTGRITAITDNAYWLFARPVYRDGRLSGLDDARLMPLLGEDGRALQRTRSYDSEGLSIVDGVAHVSFERVHQVMRFDIGARGGLARGRALPMPSAARALRGNKSLEAVGVAPRRHPLAGAVVAIAERSGDEAEPTLGLILNGAQAGGFQVARSGSYDITDLAFLELGDMLILERRASLTGGVGMRIRRIAAGDLRRGATIDGPIVIEADLEAEIDNMEGLSVHQDETGQTVISLISDDNFAFYQRTLLLEFVLD